MAREGRGGPFFLIYWNFKRVGDARYFAGEVSNHISCFSKTSILKQYPQLWFTHTNCDASLPLSTLTHTHTCTSRGFYKSWLTCGERTQECFFYFIFYFFIFFIIFFLRDLSTNTNTHPLFFFLFLILTTNIDKRGKRDKVIYKAKVY